MNINMTTAHRPTFDPVKGKKAFEGSISHSKMQPGHTKLKYRHREELDEDKIRQLEASSSKEKTKELLLEKESNEDASNLKADQREEKEEDDSEEYSSEEEEEEEEDDDDEEELMKELAKIKQERAALRAQEEAKQKLEQRKKELGIDVLQSKDKKRDWTEASLFQNQAKKTRTEPDTPKNDLLTSEFHKKFLNKYVG